MTLLLRRSEVAGLLDLRQAMRVLEQTFREQSEGRVKQVAPLRLMNRGMRMVVGGLEAQDKNGLRVSVTGGKALALLFEISSGKLLIRLSQQGAIAWDNVAEFCDVVVGKIAAPDLARNLIIFRDSQGGFGDLALAAWVYEEARRQGLGQEVSAE